MKKELNISELIDRYENIDELEDVKINIFKRLYYNIKFYFTKKNKW